MAQAAGGFDISRRMSDQRTRDTTPEVALRHRLHAMGLRYRLHRSVLQGSRRTHDIVFVGPRVVVDVHGCFWHGCEQHYVAPMANAEFWSVKIAGNRARDADTHNRLEEAGWTHVIVWEHEDPDAAAERVASVVRTSEQIRVTRP
jgi:DNA mismatch endonuclease, patch repair protein